MSHSHGEMLYCPECFKEVTSGMEPCPHCGYGTQFWIGLSVSSCIKDIIQGKVKEEHVLWIIAGIKVKTQEDYDYVSNIYSKSYWYDDPEMGKLIFSRFWNGGKILMPRLKDDDNFPSISLGHWIPFDRVHDVKSYTPVWKEVL